MNNTDAYPRFRWFVLAVMLFTNITQSIVMFGAMSLIGEIAKSLGVNVGTASGLVIGLPVLIGAFSAIGGGFVLDRFGLVRSYIAANILTITGTLMVLIPSISHSLIGMTVARCVIFLAQGPIIASVVRVAAEWFPPNERPLVTSFQQASIAIGMVAGFSVAPSFFAYFGSWVSALAATAIFPVIAMGLAIFWALGSKTPELSSLPDNSTGAIQNDFKLAMRMRTTMFIILAVCAINWIFGAFNDLTPGYLAIEPPVGVGLGSAVSGYQMSVMQVGSFFGAMLSGIIVQRIFRGKTKSGVLLGFLATALLIFCLKFSIFYGNQGVLATTLFITGFFLSLPTPCIYAFIAKQYPAHMTGRIGGLAMGIGSFFTAIGVFVGSAALHGTGNYQLSILILSIVGLVGVIISLGLNPPKAFLPLGNQPAQNKST